MNISSDRREVRSLPRRGDTSQMEKMLSQSWGRPLCSTATSNKSLAVASWPPHSRVTCIPTLSLIQITTSKAEQQNNRNVKTIKMSKGSKCQNDQNVKRIKMLKGSKCHNDQNDQNGKNNPNSARNNPDKYLHIYKCYPLETLFSYSVIKTFQLFSWFLVLSLYSLQSLMNS